MLKGFEYSKGCSQDTFTYQVQLHFLSTLFSLSRAGDSVLEPLIQILYIGASLSIRQCTLPTLGWKSIKFLSMRLLYLHFRHFIILKILSSFLLLVSLLLTNIPRFCLWYGLFLSFSLSSPFRDQLKKFFPSESFYFSLDVFLM